jgi:hypothetical protein
MTPITRALSWFLTPPAIPAARHRTASDADRPWPHDEPHEIVRPTPAADTDPAHATPPREAPSPAAARRWWPAPAPRSEVAAGDLTTAAVLGRAGEAEPVAAGVALALCRSAKARAGTVVVLGGAELAVAPAAGSGGTRAARRLAARLDSHGLPVRARGRLVWVPLPAGDATAAAVRRAMLVGAPAVLALTVPRTAALEELLAEQDVLLVVARDPDEPLARLATAGHHTSPVLVARALGRGPARTFARHGLLAPRPLRELIAEREATR